MTFDQAAIASPNRAELEDKHLAELHALASASGIARFKTLRRDELIDAILASPGALFGSEERELVERPTAARADVAEPEAEPPAEPDAEPPEPAGEVRSGVLDLVPDGFGFMRVAGFSRSHDDVYVSRSQIRALGLREGDEISGRLRPLRRSERHPSLAAVESVNGEPAEEVAEERRSFDSLTAVQPVDRLRLERGADDFVGRMVDLVAPVHKGQRVIVAAPPRAGATTLAMDLVSAATQESSVAPIVLLVDARPEEVTTWQRSLDVPLHASTSDRSADAHVRFASLALANAKRRVEKGEDVLLVIDSIARLARARALSRSQTRHDEGESDGRWAAVETARRWFAAGRNTEEAGSLTVLATTRVESGSTLDELLHESLADLASAELRLDAELVLAGLVPPIDPRRSFVRREGTGAGAEQADPIGRLHRALELLTARDSWQELAERIRRSGSNEELLAEVASS